MRKDTQDAADFMVEAMLIAATKLVDDTNAVIAEKDPIHLVQHFAQLGRIADAVKDARAIIVALHEKLSYQEIPDLFREREVKTLNIDGVGRVTVNYRWNASMPDKEKGLEWLRANGHAGLIIETVAAPTLSAFAKEQTLEGKGLPSDIFKVASSPYTSITKTYS